MLAHPLLYLVMGQRGDVPVASGGARVGTGHYHLIGQLQPLELGDPGRNMAVKAAVNGINGERAALVEF